MVRTNKVIKRLIMSCSIQERKKKKLDSYRKDIKRFQKMEKDELDLEQINMKTEYEHRKNVMSILLLSMVLYVLMDIWKFFHGFIESIINYNVVYQADEIEIMQVVFTIFIIFISSIILAILIFYMRRMKHIHRRILIIEALKDALTQPVKTDGDDYLKLINN